MSKKSLYLEVTGPLTGNNTLTKSGGGILVLSATNTFAGKLNVDDGYLAVNGFLLANSPGRSRHPGGQRHRWRLNRHRIRWHSFARQFDW